MKSVGSNSEPQFTIGKYYTINTLLSPPYNLCGLEGVMEVGGRYTMFDTLIFTII